ncbi:MAG TPA: phosphoribosyltransferase [Terracidiphilus sp.]
MGVSWDSLWAIVEQTPATPEERNQKPVGRAYNLRCVNEVLFQDRTDAGRMLARIVAAAPGLSDAIVLGLARGGVPVAYQVAVTCGFPLDVIIVRKLGAPRCREFAMGAIASGGAMVLNHDAVREFRVTEEQLRTLIDCQRNEIDRLETTYREGRPPAEFGDRGVILVDDGLATGASIRAAVRAVRPRAKQVTIAVPVAAKSSIDEIAMEVDRVICVARPERLEAVSLFYRDFSPTSDDEVRALLAEAGKRQGIGVREQGSGIKSDGL